MRRRDKEFARRVSNGDAAACAEFVRMHYERVYRFLVHMCRHEHIAEDLTQETFAAAWVATDKDMERAIYREGAAARLLASTRILAGQAGTDKYVSRTLAYIAQEYPNTIAAREIAASNKRQGDER